MKIRDSEFFLEFIKESCTVKIFKNKVLIKEVTNDELLEILKDLK